MKNPVISLSELHKECDVKEEDESIVIGTLRTLRITGDVLWLKDHGELRNVVFTDPQWVLQLIWLVFILKHEKHMDHPEEHRTVEAFDVYDKMCLSKEEKEMILSGKITYEIGEV